MDTSWEPENVPLGSVFAWKKPFVISRLREGKYPETYRPNGRVVRFATAEAAKKVCDKLNG